MKRAGKFFGYTTAVISGLILLVVIGLQLISDEQYKTWISRAVSVATGRDFTIKGAFDLHLGTTVSLFAEDIHFSNAAWSAQQEMVSADKLFVQVALFPLLKGILDCSAELDGAAVLLETDTQGNANWVFDAAKEEQEHSRETVAESSNEPFSLPFTPFFRTFSITNFTLRYVDGKSGQNLHAGVQLLRLSIDNEAIPFTLKAAYQHMPIELAGTLGNVPDFRKNRATPIDLRGTINTAPLSVKGSLGPLNPSIEMELSLSLNAASLAPFAPLTSTSLPQLEGLSIKLTTFMDNGTLSAKAITLGIDDPKLRLTATGSIADLSQFSGINIEAAAHSNGLQPIADTFHLKLPGTLPDAASLTARAQGSLEKLTIKNLEAEVKDAGVTVGLSGSIEDIITFKGVQATINGELDSLASLNELAGSTLPHTGPWSLELDMDTPALLERPLHLAGSLHGEGIQTTLQASLPDIAAPQTFEAELNIAAESAASLNDLLDQNLPALWPLNIQANVTGQPKAYTLSDFFMQLGAGTVSGSLTYAPPDSKTKTPTSIHGGLHIQDLDITPLLTYEDTVEEEQAALPAEPPEEAVNASLSDEPQTGEKFFSNTPFKEGPLRNHDIDMAITTENFTVAENFALKSDIHLTLRQGLMRIAPIQLGSSAGGQGDGTIVLDAQGERATIMIALHYDELVPPGLNGVLDVDVNLNGSGASMAELMASLDGYFITALTNVEIPHSFATQFGGGLLYQINPFIGKTTTLECAIIRFDAEDGLVNFDRKIALQTSDVTWMGAGEIDLNTEAIDIGIQSNPRKTANALTHAGIAGLVHVGGTLADPRIGIDLADAAKKYASYTALVATGGLSFIIQKLFATRKANKNQCERIIAEGKKEE